MENHHLAGQFLDSITEENCRNKGREVSQKALINKLNSINFHGGHVLITLSHRRYPQKITLKAAPQPCFNAQVDLLWLETEAVQGKLKTYEFDHLIISDGLKLIVVRPDLVGISPQGMRILLPKMGCEVRSRKTQRFPCLPLQVDVIQNSAHFKGVLQDFTACSFAVKLSTVAPQTFNWLNPNEPVMVVLSNDTIPLFGGECHIVYQSWEQKTRTVVLHIQRQVTPRFKTKEFRSPRQELIPSPNIQFLHPLTEKKIDLGVINLSGTGLAVEEDLSHSVLLPGLIIPELQMTFATSFTLTCMAQVIYRRPRSDDPGETRVICGLAILDMKMEEHVNLLSLLQQVNDPRSYLCNRVDLDALWHFFFETGFIYPEKYAHIQAKKERFKKTYEKLYTESPRIARHFIYQDKGVIMGHMAMLRIYSKTWLIHHHAADRTLSQRAGLVVLEQIGSYINDSHNLHSSHMNFVMCYFRPDNKFPRRVFGGVAKYINNPKGCSTDDFVYFYIQPDTTLGLRAEGSCHVQPTVEEDLVELSYYYEHLSGGLMIPAIDLEPGIESEDEPDEEFSRLGLKRQRLCFSLKRDGELQAMILINLSDAGLNMSELTNCIQVIVLDQDNLTRGELMAALNRLGRQYFESDKIPAILYPVKYAKDQDIKYDKIYTMWILNCQNLDQYFKFCNTFLARI